MTTRTRNRSGNVILIGLLLILAGIIIGAWLSSKEQTVAQQPEISAVGVLSAPGCYIPVGLLSLLTLIAAGVGTYYGKKRLDAQVRIWRARAEAREADVERQRVEMDDLTTGPDGQEVARVVKIGDRLLLIKSGIATDPVTIVEPKSAAQPNQTPDQLKLAAILSSALKQAGSGLLRHRSAGGGNPLDGLALMMAARGLGPGWNEGRVPANVRVMTEAEAAMLENGEG